MRLDLDRSRTAPRPRRTRGGAVVLPWVLGGLALAATAVTALGVLGARSGRRAGPDPVPLPGHPRLVGVLGGSVRHDDVADAPRGVREPVHHLHRGRVVVGRDPSADIRLEEDTVSPRHVALDVDEVGHATVHDLGARNGLLVDGRPVASARLHDGARLTLGEAQLVFRHDER